MNVQSENNAAQLNLIPEMDYDELIERGEKIEYAESEIDRNETVYLMTFSPDPANLPDCDPHLQHYWCLDFISGFLGYCKSGLFCLEYSQMGNPHYHGWYQVDDINAIYKACRMKMLTRFGLCKITKAKSYKINSYSERMNALHYYKKEVFTLAVRCSIIDKDTKPPIDVGNTGYMFFMVSARGLSPSKRLEVEAYQAAQSHKQFMIDFYKDSR